MIPRQILDDHVIRVLLIAPDEADHALVARLAADSRHGQYHIDVVTSAAAGHEAVAAEHHDVYLVENRMDAGSAVEFVAESINSGSSAPYIVLTREADYDLDLEALSIGASDVLVTSRLTADSLERAIRHALVHAQTRAELISAKQEAEAATKAKTKFLANVSHDVRTPLNAIIGMTEIVLRDSLTPMQRESLETVLIAGQSLLDLADNLTDVAKIESGEITLDPAPFNVRDAVADVVRIFKLRAEQKGLAVNVDIPTHVPETVVSDGGRIQQVLIDLVSNAVRYTDRGHIDISVNGIEEHQGSSCIRFSVEDTGAGIPADLQSSIFERSVEATTSSSSTGLGVAQRIVTAMGGEMSLQSKLGSGSRFDFTVAVQVADASLSDVDRSSPNGGGVILVMSSSPDDRRTLETDLAGGGFETIIVGDIGAATETAANAAGNGQPLDGIVLDTAYKPFDVARVLMDLAGGATPVTLLVPSGREGDEPRCREAGIKGYVGKPTPPGLLVDVVKATIAAARAGETDTLFTAETLGSTRPTMNILVVDDVETNLVLTVRMLTERGHSATAARSGVEAIDAFEQARFDAVLMDLQMPVLDGFDTTAAMRAEEVLRSSGRTPIIALTGHTTNEERERCVAAGMDGFLSKPVRPDALFAAVEQFATANPVAA